MADQPNQTNITTQATASVAVEQPKGDVPTKVESTKPSEKTGISKAVEMFGSSIKEPPKESPKTTEQNTKVQAAKDATPETKPSEKQDVDWEKVDPKIKGAHFKTKRELETKLSDYEKRIKDIESKPVEAPADAKLIEQHQATIKELNERLAALDYRSTDEFKRSYVDPYNREYKSAVNSVTKMMLTIPGKDGSDPQKRPATAEDFEKIRRLSPDDQDIALDMFGPHKARVMAHILELQRIEQNAENAMQEHSKNAETRTKENELKSQRDKSEYERLLKSSDDELKKQWPNYFDVAEGDEEVSKAIKEGYEYVDSVLQKAGSLSLEEKAAYNSVIRARAAAMPRLALELDRTKAEIKSLKEELAKFKATDPGSSAEHPETKSNVTEAPIKGIAAAAAAFKQ